MLTKEQTMTPLDTSKLPTADRWRISAAEALMMFRFDKHLDGSVTIRHQSNSLVTFGVNGDIILHAANTIRVASEKYVLLGKGGGEAEADDIALQAAIDGSPEAIYQIFYGQLGHLEERAVALGINPPR